MSGLDCLRECLNRPDLTEEHAEWLLSAVAGCRETALLRFSPREESLSCKEIADRESCSRGPVVKRLSVWLSRARVLLAEQEDE